MNSLKSSKKSIIGAVVFTVLLLGTTFLGAVGSVQINTQQTNQSNTTPTDNDVYVLDRHYDIVDPEPASVGRSDNDDAGTKKDAGNILDRATPIYPGEVIDDTPGRGRAGKLNATTSDQQDWYYFGVCDGQSIQITMTPQTHAKIDLGLWDQDGIQVASSAQPGDLMESITYTALYTGRYNMQLIHYGGTAGAASYTFTINIVGQNDAGTHADAANTFAGSVLITPGLYYGYVDMNDAYDFYKFQVTSGQGIHLELNVRDFSYLSDFDVTLYNPSGEEIYATNEFYDDDLLYPADQTGQWAARVDIYPGWVDVPHPTGWTYFSYGAGPYSLELTLETSAPPVPGPIPQPDIIPKAKTFIVANDFASSKDEYGYLASVPAANYLSGGQRYLAPIVYSGDTTSTNYYDNEKDRGTVQNTTDYLLNDWEDYLALFGKTPAQYNVPADPIAAAAEIATQNFGTNQLAVVAVDGSGYTDEVSTILSKTKTLKRVIEIEEIAGDSSKIKSIGGYGYPMLITPKWCAINVSMFGTNGQPSLSTVLPHFISKGTEWWPYESTAGDKTDLYQPLTRAGIWTAGTDRLSANWNFRITKFAGDRYHFKVKDADSVLNFKITTDEPADLMVFLVDPDGYLRAPVIPSWNGQYVNPVHVWNGCHFDETAGGYEPWRRWLMLTTPHTEVTAEVLHPDEGWWTAIVVPTQETGGNVKYTIAGELRTVNAKRADAEISAANAAVIASLNHVPLLYVKEDSVPAQTASAFTALGVTKVIFVERGEIGSAVRSSLPTLDADLKTMEEIVDHIKSYEASENYITATSLKSGNGYFAPAAMLAAYHGSPILRIEDAPGNPAAMAQRLESWVRWDGDYYHGERSTGHLPEADAPIAEKNRTGLGLLFRMLKFLISGTGDLPPFGLDAKRYWTEEMYTEFHDYVVSLGLDVEGQEGYCIVAPRDDIPVFLHSALMGNNSYAGQIPGMTPAYSSDIIVRDVLYPALIFANPGRDITTSQMMNFPDSGTWTTNDGKVTAVYSSRELKRTFSTHGRTFDGHCLWVANLERMNNGASILYYSGHGTGGSGCSAQYQQTEFCNYPEQEWWDGWRGYMFDNWKTPRDGGFTWYNPDPANLYDLIHYDYVDGYYQNLHSAAVLYMSCTTGDGDGPMVYMDHGAAYWYGNANTGLCPEADLADDYVFQDAFNLGEPIGPAFSKQVWLHYRDFTTSDPMSMYGPSSMQVTTIQVIYGDPSMIVYSPEWQAPVPIDA